MDKTTSNAARQKNYQIFYRCESPQVECRSAAEYKVGSSREIASRKKGPWNESSYIKEEKIGILTRTRLL